MDAGVGKSDLQICLLVLGLGCVTVNGAPEPRGGILGGAHHKRKSPLLLGGEHETLYLQVANVTTEWRAAGEGPNEGCLRERRQPLHIQEDSGP